MGRPKALIEVGGRTLIERTVDVARSISTDVVLLGKAPFDLPAALKGMEILPDRFTGIGPIGGLDALMTSRMGRNCVLLACDMPRLCESVLARLTAMAGAFDAVVPRTPSSAGEEARLHPCCAMYRASARGAVGASIESGEYAMMALLEWLRVCPLELSETEAAQLVNWNFPGDVNAG